MCDYCSWIEKILHPKIEDLPTVCTNIVNVERGEQNVPKPPVKYDPTIIVHGTADSVSSREEINAILENIEKAAIEAYKELVKGCQAAEAVELAIRCLENTGSSPDNEGFVNTLKGNNLLGIRDAAMMDNESNAGSVGAATDTLHPITLAKKVLRDTDHILIVGSGIRKLEISSNNPSQTDKSNEMLPMPPDSRITKEIDIDATKKIQSINSSAQKGMKLYGAVSRDRKGRLTCGISTMDDRDESIVKSSMTSSGTVIGCGIFSNAEFCCSVSSEDRAIYLYAPARKIVERLQREREAKKDSNALIHIENAMNDELNNFFKDTGESCIGAAALKRDGKPEVAFTSNFFPWASCINGVITSGCIKDEVFEKDVGELDMPLDCRCD